MSLEKKTTTAWLCLPMHTSVRRNALVDIGIIYMPTKAVLSLRMFDMYVLPADLVFLTYVQLLTTVREKKKSII